MKDSFTKIHYNEEIRPYSHYAHLLCEQLADKYLGARSGKLLDVCCGRGEHMEIFSGLGFDAYGVDKEGVAKEKGLNVEIVDIDLEDLTYEDNFFDFIMVKSSIEHIRDVYHLMDNLHRVLKPGGKIIILTCDWKTVYKIFYDTVDHKTPFTQFSLHDLLLRYDFQDVRVEYFYHLPFTWKNRFSPFIARLIAFFIPINYSQTIKLNAIIKLIKFSREKQILGYGVKPLDTEDV